MSVESLESCLTAEQHEAVRYLVAPLTNGLHDFMKEAGSPKEERHESIEFEALL